MILGLGLVVNFVDLGDIGRRYQIKVLKRNTRCRIALENVVSIDHDIALF